MVQPVPVGPVRPSTVSIPNSFEYRSGPPKLGPKRIFTPHIGLKLNTG